MKTKYCGLGARTWFATIAVVVTVTIVAALGALAVAASATSHHASNDNAVSGAAWFAEPAPPLSGNAIAGPAIDGKGCHEIRQGDVKGIPRGGKQGLAVRGDDHQFPGDS